MEAALRALLPKIIGQTSFQIYPHSGKQALLRRLPQRLKTYRRILQPGWLILIVVDRDNEVCRDLKTQLEQIAAVAGLSTRTSNPAGPFALVNRIAVEELEAWYFGDWEAVRAAYPRVSRTIHAREGYRDPDAIVGGTWEAFERIMRASGYFAGGLPKIEAALRIAPHMDPTRNNSGSFKALRDALLSVCLA